jgi:response regulator RpfG family c-di-GMP phosphodiesterase
LYVNTGIQSIDREITEVFSEYVCQTEEESNVALVSRKTVLPGDIERLAQNNRRIILLVDSGDRDLIRAAKQLGVKDLFFSPVKIDSIEKRINEIIAEMQDNKEGGPLTGEQAETKQKEENRSFWGKAVVPDMRDETTTQEDSLDELLACIKAQVRGNEELEALRRENEELKRQLKRYEDFVEVLAEIFGFQKGKGVEKA